MPKPKHDIKEFHWLALKEQVQKTYSHNISASSDIQRLHTDIYTTIGESLSPSTLYRLLLSPTNKNIPYQNTLDVLSDYCGFHNWTSFCKQQDHKTSIGNKKEVLPDAMGLRLLQICLQNHDFKSVLDYTKLLPEPYVVDYPTLIKISELFGSTIRHDSVARKVLLKEFAKTPQGRHFFYETFVDLDNLDGYYGDSLAIYKKFSPKLDKNKSLNDFLFTECLGFWRAYKNNDIRMLKRIGYQLFEIQEEKEIQEENDLHFFPVSRWHAYRLIYWHYLGKTSPEKIEQTISQIETLIKGNLLHVKRIYLSKLFEALTIIRQEHFIIPLFNRYNQFVSSEYMESEGLIEFFSLAKNAYISQGKLNEANNVCFPAPNLTLIRTQNTYNYATYSL